MNLNPVSKFYLWQMFLSDGKSFLYRALLVGWSVGLQNILKILKKWFRDSDFHLRQLLGGGVGWEGGGRGEVGRGGRRRRRREEEEGGGGGRRKIRRKSSGRRISGKGRRSGKRRRRSRRRRRRRRRKMRTMTTTTRRRYRSCNLKYDDTLFSGDPLLKVILSVYSSYNFPKIWKVSCLPV